MVAVVSPRAHEAESTFSSMTVEELLDADVLPAYTATALRKRYLPG